MELRRIGDTILRSRSSPVLSFLAPHVPARAWQRYSVIKSVPLTQVSPTASSGSKRTFATGSVASAEAIPRTGSQQTSGSDSSLTDEAFNNSEIKSMVDGLTGGYKKPVSSSKRIFRSPPGDSGTDITKEFQNYTRSYRGRVDANRMLDPTPQPSSQSNIHEQVRADITKAEPIARLRLGPSVGRSVPIDSERGMDLGRGFRQLDMNCYKNQVRGDFMRQRFHERAGLKRKRLRSLRWRKRFKDGFRAVVGKVEDMRRRGW